MGIIDDHLGAMKLEHVQAAGRFVERRVEAAQALPNIVEVGTGGVRGGRRRQRVLDVGAGPALEGRRHQVNPRDLGAAPPLA